jgi:DNA repair protein RecO (recombination protein O)
VTGSRRVTLEPAYLLHHHPWRDSSRILELLTREHGRVAVIARSSRQSGARTGSALQPFTSMLVSWSARGELGTLTGVERRVPPSASPGASDGSGPSALEPGAIEGDRLMSGFYANELLLKLLQRNDPHPALFDAYEGLVGRLRASATEAIRGLRLFEKRLLEELGWGLSLEREADGGAPVEPARSYRYALDGGAEPLDGVAEGSLIFCGSSLLSLARDELDDPRSLADARRLLRAALDRLLDGRPLRTREVMFEMRAHAARPDGD